MSSKFVSPLVRARVLCVIGQCVTALLNNPPCISVDNPRHNPSNTEWTTGLLIWIRIIPAMTTIKIIVVTGIISVRGSPTSVTNATTWAVFADHRISSIGAGSKGQVQFHQSPIIGIWATVRITRITSLGTTRVIRTSSQFESR